MNRPREFWILKTPGGEFIEYDEPIGMDWSCCKKISVIEKQTFDELLELAKQMHLDLHDGYPTYRTFDEWLKKLEYGK